MAKKDITKKFKIKSVWHVGRNQYGNTPIDSLLKFFYRYKFHQCCLKFVCMDEHTGEERVFTSVIEAAIWLHNLSDGNKGVPIISEGVKTYHASRNIKDNPYFYCKITVNSKGETSADIKRNSQVISYSA